MTFKPKIAPHAVTLATEGVFSGGRQIIVDACLHRDRIHAAENARLVRAELEKTRMRVIAP